MIYQLDTTRKVITIKGAYPIKEVLKEIKKIDGWEEYSLEQEVHTVPTYPYYKWFGDPIPCDFNVPHIYDTNVFTDGTTNVVSVSLTCDGFDDKQGHVFYFSN